MIEQAHETIFSFQHGVPQHLDDSDEDGAGRPGSFVQGSSRTACFLQRITAGGALLRATSTVLPGERLNLELTRGLSIDGTVAWQSGSRIGVSFDSRLDVIASIARDLGNQPDERRRMPRIELRCTACVQTRTSIEFATTRDISEGGIQIETGLPLEIGETVEIALDGLPTLAATVRWVKDARAGLEFASPLGWQVLMPWMKSMSRMTDRRPANGGGPDGRALAIGADPLLDGAPISIAGRIREGTHRWNIVVTAIDERQFAFSTLAAVGIDTLVWLFLPQIEGWPARIVRIEHDRFVGAFTHPLRPAVLERIRASRG